VIIAIGQCSLLHSPEKTEDLPYKQIYRCRLVQ